MKRQSVLLAAAAGGIAFGATGLAIAQGSQGGMGQGTMGPGMMQGRMGPGMMQGQGMMRGGMGQGMMGPGMMQGRMGTMMGRGMMRGGTGGIFGRRVVRLMDLSVEDVKRYLTFRLERLGNKRLKLGEVKAAGGTIAADIVTVDDSLVQRLEVDRRTGAITYKN